MPDSGQQIPDSREQIADGRSHNSRLLSAIRYLLSRHALPIATIACIAATLFAPAILHHEVFTFRDHTDYFQPLRYYTAEYLRVWRLPLWNPYNASGEPWLANPQTGVFYPPTWLFIALPFAAAYMSYLLFHVALLGINAYVLFARNATRGAAMVGAIALMLCGPTVSLWDVNNNLATFAWIPLAIWCGLERRPLLGGVVLALAFLGGEPFFASIAALLFVLACRQRRAGAIAAITAFGLSAVQLLPFLELVRSSDRRSGFDLATIFRDSMSIRDWLRIAVPAHGLGVSLSQHFIPVVYVGVVTVVLALFALSAPRKAWPWLVLLGASIVIAAGDRLPTGDWIARLPLTLFRYPARLVPFGALAVAALAVIGLDRIPKRRVWIDLALIVVLLVDLVPSTLVLRVVGALRTDRVPYPAAVGRDLKTIRIGSITTNRDAWIAGYLNLYQRRFDAATAAPVAAQPYIGTLTSEIVGKGIDHLDRMGVGWVITDRPMPRDHFALAARADDVFAWRSRGALPMARVVQHDGSFHNVQALALDASRARVVIDTPHGGTLVLTQQTAPGWSVFIDGRAANARVYDRVFRAATVPPGKHEILWIFKPFSLLAGGFISAVTLVTLLIALARETATVK